MARKLSFEEWKRSVDRADWFEDDVKPDAAACRAIREAGG